MSAVVVLLRGGRWWVRVGKPCPEKQEARQQLTALRLRVPQSCPLPERSGTESSSPGHRALTKRLSSLSIGSSSGWGRSRNDEPPSDLIRRFVRCVGAVKIQ